MSAQETTDNFWKFWNNFTWREPEPVIYRCYYKEDGTPDFYTMEDLPGNWVEVSQEIYINCPLHGRVIDGKLVLFEPKTTVRKLRPVMAGGVACDRRDVCVIVDPTDSNLMWSFEHNDIY